MNNDWSPAAAQLIEKRPALWEYRLFSQCLLESVEQQLSAPSVPPSASELAKPKYTFSIGSAEQGSQFAIRTLEEVENFAARLKFAIKVSPDDQASEKNSPVVALLYRSRAIYPTMKH